MTNLNQVKEETNKEKKIGKTKSIEIPKEKIKNIVAEKERDHFAILNTPPLEGAPWNW